MRTTGVKYKPERFHYLGSAEDIQSAFIVFKSAGVKSIEDVKNKQLLMGSTGKGSQTYILPTLANALLGTKFKVIAGYLVDRGRLQIPNTPGRADILLRPQALVSSVHHVHHQ